MQNSQAHPSRSAPLCFNCAHAEFISSRDARCNHPSTPASAIDGSALLPIEKMRGSASARLLKDIYGIGKPCGIEGALFVRGPKAAPKVGQGIDQLIGEGRAHSGDGAGLHVSADQGGVGLRVALAEPVIEPGYGDV